MLEHQSVWEGRVCLHLRTLSNAADSTFFLKGSQAQFEIASYADKPSLSQLSWLVFAAQPSIPHMWPIPHVVSVEKNCHLEPSSVFWDPLRELASSTSRELNVSISWILVLWVVSLFLAFNASVSLLCLFLSWICMFVCLWCLFLHLMNGLNILAPLCLLQCLCLERCTFKMSYSDSVRNRYMGE